MLTASDDAFAVVGRHPKASVALPEDPGVALRHLLVRSIALPAGGVALRVLDLRTGLGFGLPDGSRCASIFAEGPIALALGETALVALPAARDEGELPGELSDPIVTALTSGEAEALAAALHPYRQGARRPQRGSLVTLMPAPVTIGEPPSRSAEYALTLSRREKNATVAVSEEDLARGVLIGRADSCHAEELRRVTHENTSRVHLLVLREGRSVHAYDVVSTHGTYREGAPVARVRLADRGTSLTLGVGRDAVRLAWQRCA
jgi:hypothetical protein